jgi:hypothetical protein
MSEKKRDSNLRLSIVTKEFSRRLGRKVDFVFKSAERATGLTLGRQNTESGTTSAARWKIHSYVNTCLYIRYIQSF